MKSWNCPGLVKGKISVKNGPLEIALVSCLLVRRFPEIQKIIGIQIGGK